MKHPMLEKIGEQLKELMYELHVDIPKQLEHARSLGDLSENAEYEMTKERQLFVESRIKHFEDLHKALRNLNLDNLPTDKAAYGSRVHVEDIDTGEQKYYRMILAGEEPINNHEGDIHVTMASPVAKALLGKSVGDEIQVFLPKGSFDWEVIGLETYHDLKISAS